MKKIGVLACLALILSGCATGGTTISESADLSKYNYATITNVMDYGGSPTLMDIVRVYDVLSATGLTMIGIKK